VRECISRQIHLLLKSRQTHRRKAHTRRRLESSVVFGFSSLSLIFSFFSSLTGRDQCRPCSSYYYYYKHRYTYIYLYTPKHYHYYIIIFRRRCTLQSELSCVCVCIFSRAFKPGHYKYGVHALNSIQYPTGFSSDDTSAALCFFYYQFIPATLYSNSRIVRYFRKISRRRSV